MSHSLFLFTLLLASLANHANCDIPADCRYETTLGKWVFDYSTLDHAQPEDCSKFEVHPSVEGTYWVDLQFPNIAVDQYGNKGFWTLVYNQGFEVVVGGRKYYAFFKYKVEFHNGIKVNSMIWGTLNGL
jgi:cathepsin C